MKTFWLVDKSEVGYNITWPIAAHHMVHMVQFLTFPFPLFKFIYFIKFILLNLYFFNSLDQSEVGYKMTWPIAAHHMVHMVQFLTFPFPLWFIYLNLYFFNSLDQSEVGYKMTWPIAAHHMVHMV